MISSALLMPRMLLLALDLLKSFPAARRRLPGEDDIPVAVLLVLLVASRARRVGIDSLLSTMPGMSETGLEEEDNAHPKMASGWFRARLPGPPSRTIQYSKQLVNLVVYLVLLRRMYFWSTYTKQI